MALDPGIILGVQAPKMANPLETLQQIGQVRMQQQAIQNNQALEEERRQQIAARGQAMQEQRKIASLTQQAFIPDEQTGIYAFNRPLFEKGLIQSGLGHLYEKLAPRMDAMEKSAQTLVASKRSLLAHTVDAIGEAGWTPDAVDNAAQFLVKNEAYDPARVKPLLDDIHQNPDPAHIQTVLTGIVKGLPEWQDLQSKKEDETAKRDLGKANLRKAIAEATNLETYGAATRPPDSASHREWIDYVNEAVKAGQTPLAYNDYMTMDANRKKPITVLNQQAQQDALQKLIEPTVDADGKTKPAPLIQQAVNGLIDPNKVASNNRWTPTGLAQFKSEILKVDPDWNENRFKIRQNYTNGTSQPSKNIIALNTAANHMGLSYDLALAMKNGDTQLINQITNYARTQLGYSGPSDAVMVAGALGAETASALKGANASATDPEIDNWVKVNSTSRSPEQIVSNAKTLGRILAGRMRPLQTQWQQTYGKGSYFPILDDSAKAAFDKVGVDTSSVTGPSAQTGTTPGVKILSIKKVGG